MSIFIFRYVLPFLLPAAVFVLWTWLRGRWVERHGGQAPAIEDGPWFWLSLSGGLLVLAVVALTAVMGGDAGRPGEIYVPPHVVDGKVVPGQYQPAD